ncbi:N-acetylmuramoyl-L-alanine amidase [Clostridium cavendishii DSM 21758]|uniref:N-acetylmuramoyl-L-alanine amidase n=1 Tax=Clostridium cavendishii DSM 21758 TaxID=1121302 RepID=A0A1M6HTZ5_9CLOT|nr:peptidoglycan recognition family protein [Clostridium cavendishii]SHJ25653.1 N-acetylmuramoyl-L-alanine amidase [Clostridium cavendishii DSM 21758]
MKRQFKILLSLVALIVTFFISDINVQAMSIKQEFINNNRSYRSLKPIGIVIHDTCNEGATAKNNRDYFNRVYVGASAHYFVDWNEVIQTIPSNEQAWHAGGYANRNYISIEMCNPKSGNIEQFNNVYIKTVELAAQICKANGWNVRDNVFSHKYISDTYKQTDHQDPYAFLAKYNKSWDKLCEDIQKAIEGGNIESIYPKDINIQSEDIHNSFTHPNNAQIKNDFFYIRDENGNVIPNRRVDIGDKVTILDISYSKQLIKLEYPTPLGVRRGWIKNSPNYIRYFYKNQYKNGSTLEDIYQNSDVIYKIGSISKYEEATVLYRNNGILHVAYSTKKGTLTKSGFVKYNDHFNKF